MISPCGGQWAYGGEVDSTRFLSEAMIGQILEVQTNGVERVLAVSLPVGMGFGLIGGILLLRLSERAYFSGAGGRSVAAVDFDASVSVAYATNWMEVNPLAGSVATRWQWRLSRRR